MTMAWLSTYEYNTHGQEHGLDVIRAKSGSAYSADGPGIQGSS